MLVDGAVLDALVDGAVLDALVIETKAAGNMPRLFLSMKPLNQLSSTWPVIMILSPAHRQSS